VDFKKSNQGLWFDFYNIYYWLKYIENMKNDENKAQKPEENFKKDEMSKAQETYIKELTIKTGQKMDPDLSREEADEKIEKLEEESGKRNEEND